MRVSRWIVAVAIVGSLGACEDESEATCYADPDTGNVGCAEITDDSVCVGGSYEGREWVDCHER
jgi:hypothetical protein